MFTGIIEELGKIQAISQNSVTIEASIVTNDLKIGDSVACNGICLTVASFPDKSFTADVSPKTFEITNLKKLKVGDYINLERAMLANGRFGGHIVSGHIDGVAKLISVKSLGEFYELKFELNNEQAKYVINKGSISINGISLTIAEIEKNIITLLIIPHTFENTNLRYLKTGDIVNIESDVIAKYVEKFLSTSDNSSGIDLKFLTDNGF